MSRKVECIACAAEADCIDNAEFLEMIQTILWRFELIHKRPMTADEFKNRQDKIQAAVEVSLYGGTVDAVCRV
jgi:hypothetical protein